jgi:IMP dehydrogenase
MRKDAFFKAMARQRLALTFGDVRLKTGYSEKPPSEVDLASRFSRNVSLLVPIISSPMDTVTEHDMAIAMARLGGLGIIHRNLTPEDQVHQVSRVKFYMNGLITKPICAFGDETVEAVLNRLKEKGYRFHTLPVINRSGKLIGLLTRNDFDFCRDYRQTVEKIMTSDLITAPAGTSLAEAWEKMGGTKKKVLPLVDAESRVAGMYIFSDVKRIVEGKSEGHNLDSNGQLRVGAAIGVGEPELERAKLLVAAGVDVIVIDSAHGDSKAVIRTLKEFKSRFSIDVVVGNVSEGASAKRLVDAGADGIRVGQGPGSICTTRVIAGVGCPQLTAIHNCEFATRGSGVPICADGGIGHSGDVPMAIGAGASSVMLGRLLAGTNESPGDKFVFNGVTYKGYRGMGSLGAMQESSASRQRYGQNHDTGKDDLVPEGIEGAVPYQGSLQDTLHQLVEGLRRGLGYVGADNISELQSKADFNRITDIGLQESHPHDISLTKAAPNYHERQTS